MDDLHIHHFYAWLFTGFLLMLGLVVGIWGYNAHQYNAYKNTANTIIQRSGGVTSDAQISLTKLTNGRFHKQFRVTTQENQKIDNTQISSGGVIKYRIHTKLKVGPFTVTEFTNDLSTNSVIRADSQPYHD